MQPIALSVYIVICMAVYHASLIHKHTHMYAHTHTHTKINKVYPRVDAVMCGCSLHCALLFLDKMFHQRYLCGYCVYLFVHMCFVCVLCRNRAFICLIIQASYIKQKTLWVGNETLCLCENLVPDFLAPDYDIVTTECCVPMSPVRKRG